ncbi:DNA adenine methylase [Halobaculum sp. CBA1158]|uniref:DNA adenine methylase n=1 Tax=Halobaculum sp. CBA1158 TaxID=2904243 RepID=UPI001F2D7165|nr:DNA adenine methylase [Halobaculum sp. CBA1158]UIO98820.1 DNA adenine methylase [Halobaculum sp. CBA1158]
MADPVLKWAGGKRQLLEEIYARFPSEFAEYHEPFLGGGAVFFDMEPRGGTVNDTNPRLVNCYRVIRDRPEELADRLAAFDDPESDPDPELAFAAEDWKDRSVDQYFYQQRARFNRRAYADETWPDDERSRIEEAALLVYLNRTCYNGLYRENSDGGFNVPIGRYADPDWVQADRIREASDALARTEIRNEDFEYVLDAAAEGDLVYVDPPYEPMSATADFAEYSAEGFDRDDQERLLRVASELDERGVNVVLSNSGVTFERYREAGFDVTREGATRSINSDETARGEVDEIIATNVPEEERSESPGQASIADF